MKVSLEAAIQKVGYREDIPHSPLISVTVLMDRLGRTYI